MTLIESNHNSANVHPHTVLIVDDNPVNLGILYRYLKRFNFDIKMAESGEEALKNIQLARPDIILLDVLMPGLNGFETCRRLKVDENTQNIPVIFITGLDDTANKIEGFKVGGVDYIGKPFQFEEVLARIRTHLALHTLQEQLETQNAQLQQEITRRQQAEEALQKAYTGLERRVEERTAELTQANITLKSEIIERQRAEESLRRSEERFRQVITSISDHIYVSERTEDGYYINRYLSPHVEALTGYPYQKFTVDRTFWPSIVIHPEDRAMAAAQALRLDQGQDSELEYRLVRANGEIVWVRDSARVQVEEGAKIIYGVVSNITRRKQAEQEIYNLTKELEQRVFSRTRELAALYDVTALAGELLDLTATLQQVLEQVLKVMQSTVGAIYLLDETGKMLRLAAHQGLLPVLAAQRSSVPLGSELEGWIFEQNEPLLVPHIFADPQASQIYGLYSQATTYVGVPIHAGKRVLGVLSILFEKTQLQPNLNEISLLLSIADHAGVVVESAQLRQRIEQAAMLEERARLARELHDSVTQLLYSINLFAKAGRDAYSLGHSQQGDKYLARLQDTGMQAIKEMRLLLYELRLPELKQGGLLKAIQLRLEAVEDRAGVKTQLQLNSTIELPEETEKELYYIVQEALNNALKHSKATSVIVRFEAGRDRLDLEITDNGAGFDLPAITNKGGMGLLNMRERAEKLGGELIILTEPGQGTTIRVSLKNSNFGEV